jgi:proline dehydrogenase
LGLTDARVGGGPLVATPGAAYRSVVLSFAVGGSVLTQKALLAASRRPGLRRLVTATPATRRVVDRFVAGETLDDALAVVRTLTADGIEVTLDHLGEDITDRAAAQHSRDAYLALLDGLAPLGLGRAAEVSVKLSAFGQALPDGGHDVALELVRPVVEAATAMGTTVTLDMEDSRTVDSTLAILAELRKDHPGTGAVLQSALHRTEDDAKALAVPGSRVRLVKGAYREPAAVAHQGRAAVDAAYARCLEILMAGEGYPMVGSHDPALIERALKLAAENSRGSDSWEIQMLYGIRPQEQQRLAAEGCRVRAYVPYGIDWYAYFMRRLAERPANLRFFLRSLATKS